MARFWEMHDIPPEGIFLVREGVGFCGESI